MSFCLVLVGNMNNCGASWKLEGRRLPPGDWLLLCPVSKGPRTPAALSKQDETACSWVSFPGALLSLLNHVSRYGPNVPPRGTPGTPAQESGCPHSRPPQDWLTPRPSSAGSPPHFFTLTLLTFPTFSPDSQVLSKFIKHLSPSLLDKELYPEPRH